MVEAERRGHEVNTSGAPSRPDNRGREPDIGEALEPDKESDKQGPEVMELLEESERELDQEIIGNFDGVGTASLPGSAVGATVPAIQAEDYGIEKQSYMLLDEDIGRMDRDHQIHTVNHENIHAETNSGELYGNLVEEGMPSETVEHLAYLMEYGSEQQKEGATEFISLWRNENSDRVAGSFYPFLTAEVSRELELAGNHPDYGLKKEIEEGVEEVFKELVLNYHANLDIDQESLYGDVNGDQEVEDYPVETHSIVYEFEPGDKGFELSGVYVNSEQVYDSSEENYNAGLGGSVERYNEGENGFSNDDLLPEETVPRQPTGSEDY